MRGWACPPRPRARGGPRSCRRWTAVGTPPHCPPGAPCSAPLPPAPGAASRTQSPTSLSLAAAGTPLSIVLSALKGSPIFSSSGRSGGIGNAPGEPAGGSRGQSDPTPRPSGTHLPHNPPKAIQGPHSASLSGQSLSEAVNHACSPCFSISHSRLHSLSSSWEAAPQATWAQYCESLWQRPGPSQPFAWPLGGIGPSQQSFLPSPNSLLASRILWFLVFLLISLTPFLLLHPAPHQPTSPTSAVLNQEMFVWRHFQLSHLGKCYGT